MIELQNVEKAYEARSTRTFVLRRISLNIKEGEFVTIMGPSGAGKSTLLSIIGMLDAAWTGEYNFLSEPVHKLKPRDRMEINKRYVGFVFQQYHLLDDLTVAENLDIPLSYRNVRKSDFAAAGTRVLGEPRIGAHGKPVVFLHPEDFFGTLIELEQA
jgi:ABC-type lipoprotein export system ATPase subunit